MWPHTPLTHPPQNSQPVANGHAITMECGGLEVIETLSPIEEGAGILHWDTYMPYVDNKDWTHHAPGRVSFAAGSFVSLGRRWLSGVATPDPPPPT